MMWSDFYLGQSDALKKVMFWGQLIFCQLVHLKKHKQTVVKFCECVGQGLVFSNPDSGSIARILY